MQFPICFFFSIGLVTLIGLIGVFPIVSNILKFCSIVFVGKIAFDGSRKRAAAESSRSSGRSGISGIANAKVAASRKCKPVGGRRAVGKLVRTDDGTGIYPSDRGQHSTFLLHTENDPSWKQYSRVRHVFITIDIIDLTIHQRLFMSYCFLSPFFHVATCQPPRTAIQQTPTFININQFINSATANLLVQL